LYESELRINARDVEDALQIEYMHLKLGHRLWKGLDWTNAIALPDDKVHTTAVVYSPYIKDLIDSGDILVMTQSPKYGDA
jgi:hypothetical protein